MSKTLVMMIINNTQSKFLELTFFCWIYHVAHTHTRANTRCDCTALPICPFHSATASASKNAINNLFHLLLIIQSSTTHTHTRIQIQSDLTAYWLLHEMASECKDEKVVAHFLFSICVASAIFASISRA